MYVCMCVCVYVCMYVCVYVCIREAENIANVELSKISAWAKEQNQIPWAKIKSNAYDRTKAKKNKKTLKYIWTTNLYFKCTVWNTWA